MTRFAAMGPTFSIIVPLHNKVDYVAETLASAAGQIPAPLEILVIDDGSTDGSAEHVEQLNIPAVRLVRQENAGVAAARNRGIELARGDLVCFLDADDRYLPGFLDAICRLRREFPDAGIFATTYRRFWAGGQSETILHPSVQFCTGYVSDLYTAWTRSAFFCTISIAVERARLLESKLRFEAGERLGEDQDLWFRLAERYPVVFEPSVFAEYRVDVAGSATKTLSVLDPLPCYQRLADRIDHRIVPEALRSGARRLVATHWLNTARSRLLVGDAAGAWRLIRDARARFNAKYRFRVGLQALALRLKLLAQ